VDVDEKLFRAVCISDAEATAYTIETMLLLSKEKLAADELSELWEASFVDCQVQRALEDLFAGDNASLVRLIKKRVPELKPSQIRQSLGRADLHVGFPTTAETLPPTPPASEGPDTTPEMRAVIIAGERQDCRYARDIVIHVANWLVAQGRLSADDCPVVVTRHTGRGADRCLVNTSAHHLDGSDFRSGEELTNGLFIETHASRLDLERYARRLLEWADVDPDIMQVRWPD